MYTSYLYGKEKSYLLLKKQQKWLQVEWIYIAYILLAKTLLNKEIKELNAWYSNLMYRKVIRFKPTIE